MRASRGGGDGDRVVHRAGTALTDDLGDEAHDLVLAFKMRPLTAKASL